MGLPYPVFTIRPDFTEPPVYGVSNMVERAGLSAAIDTAFFPQTFPDMTFSFNFAFTSGAAARELKTFFRSTAVGKLRPFYLPSWRSDLPCGPSADGAGNAGDTKVSVFCAAYANTHLSTNPPDHFGRSIFIWQPGEELYTSAVVAAEQITQGHAVLTVTEFLPFTVDPSTAIIGFCHLAHFDTDELTTDHLTSEAATAAAKFRAQREYSSELVPLSIARIDHAPYVGFVSAVQVSDAAVPNDSRVAYATGYNAWVNTDGIRLATGDPFDRSVPDNGGALSDLANNFTDTDHVSLTFDPDGDHVLAWQSGPAEFTLALHPSDPVYQTHEGIDPVLASDLTVNLSLEAGEQTNAVYYRKPSDSNLYMRLGPGYETEHIAAVLPVRPLKLKRVTDNGDRTLTLEYLDAQFRTTRIKSAQYPEA